MVCSDGKVYICPLLEKDPCAYGWSISKGSKRLYDIVAKKFVAQIDKLKSQYETAGRAKGRPMNKEAVKIIAEALIKDIKGTLCGW